jgi:uncharacterized protein (TIGR00297 family)
MQSNVLVALGLAGGIALAAHRAGSLTRSGALAATAVGSLAMLAGRSWGVYLVLWFVSASLVSRMGVHVKRRRTASVLPPREARDAWQVLANGGLFALCASWTLWHTSRGSLEPTSSGAAIMAASALAAAGADTLATEIGTWLGGTPRSLRTGQAVPPGTSGAVSLAGSLALLAGALGYAGVAAGLELIAGAAWPVVAAAAALGALADSLLGAWLQTERWCASCREPTEQNPHVCGAFTTPRRGWTALDNDGVNLLCTVSGATVAGIWFALWH